MNFTDLPLSAMLIKATQEAGYEEPTPIQWQTIPLVLDGKDVLGCAQTGTGKTAAFALPILQRLAAEKPDSERKPRALILTPTRELAIQIQENFQLYGKHLPLRSCVIFGGVSQYGQVSELRRNPQILVATPGRLNDLIGQGYIKLDHVGIFVLDEADRMLDMGFIQDVKRIIAQLPAKRQTLLFSATMPSEVETLAMSILNQPETVKVDPVSSTVDSIHQVLYMVDKANKKFLLADLLKKPEVENALVFTRTKHGADRVVKELAGMGVQAMAIHGDKSQNARQAAMGSFKSGELKVLIATDIAARGIDVIGLSHVFNYDLPNEPEAYIHRIGRTGRAGLPGDAISFCCIDEMKDLYAIEKLIGRKIPRVESAWPMQVFTETVKAPRAPRPARVKDVDRRGNAVVPRAQSADHRTPRAHTAPAQAHATTGNSATPQRTTPTRKTTADVHTAPQRSAEPRRMAAPQRTAEPRRQAAPQRSAEPRRTAAPQHTRRPAMESGPRSMRQPVPVHANRFGPTRSVERPQGRAPETQFAPQREEPAERENAAQPAHKRKFESR